MAMIVWICRNCGVQYKTTGNVPLPKAGSSCKAISTGNHVWQKVD